MKYEVEVVETIVCRVEVEANHPKTAVKIANESSDVKVIDERYSKVIQVTSVED